MKIRGVLFDLDETLIEEQASNDAAAMIACAIAAERVGIDRDALLRAMRERSLELWLGGPMIDYCRNIGISPGEGLWGSFSSADPGAARLGQWIPEYRMLTWLGALQRVGIDDRSLAAELAATFITERRARHLVFPEILPMLLDLRRNYRLALITNGATDLQREKIDGAGLGAFFPATLISGTLGIGKPRPEIFLAALSQLGLAAAEAVMIGDSLSRDIGGAGALGIRTIWINRLRRPRDQRYRSPDFELTDLRGLPAIIPPS
ncbi:MAG: HAD family hydrolase [Candidatus Binatus sp.]|uniref:HAD family hydrolase n=1 Tax=Candidatus Binatus sp. TaxID=2811406 RepID=UPI00271D243C|nr:HAD family hydrolase [Candidatus Binatus sp.]MDO8432407.1 HAD family hydrolase [Candidatus Binatus sp.]